MENKFTFTVHRYSDGDWKCVRCHCGIDGKQKRRLIYLAKRLGYTYSSFQQAYLFKINGLVTAIVKFTKDN